jgi:hypothetical protein
VEEGVVGREVVEKKVRNGGGGGFYAEGGFELGKKHGPRSIDTLCRCITSTSK